MKVSTRGRYGLRAMIDLAIHSKETHVSLASIAERQNVSLNYLEQAFSVLKKTGLVKSVKGAQGGYTLAYPPENITVYQILQVLEGDLSIIDRQVNNEGPIQYCIQEQIWDKIDTKLKELLTSITLKDLAEEYENGCAKDPMYYI
jgi:Rrf2 family protein